MTMPIYKLVKIGLIGASLYYGGKRELPPVFQGIAVVGSLTALIVAINDVLES